MDTRIYDAVRRQYGLRADAPLTGGWEALAFRVDAGGDTLFLKQYDVRRAGFARCFAQLARSLPILDWLNEDSALRGRISQPIRTLDGGFWGMDAEHMYMAYKYIAGDTPRERPLLAAQKRELAEIVALLHTHGEELPFDTAPLREDFSIPFLEELRAFCADSALASGDCAALYAHREAILRACARVEGLSAQARGVPFVLCHTDIHGWNLMQADRLILIDWDTIKLAPAEADLFSVWGEQFWGDFWREFLTIYEGIRPEYSVNAELLLFYRTRRRLEDIHDFAVRLLRDALPAAQRDDAVRCLRRECVRLGEEGL